MMDMPRRTLAPYTWLARRRQEKTMHRHGPSPLRGPRAARPRPSKADGRNHASRASDPSATPARPAPDAPIRADLVERVRREIAAGNYDTSEKLQAAVERLLRQLGPE